MRSVFAFFFGTVVIALLGSTCQTIQPPQGPGTSYPCGVWGVECSNGACCPYKHVCGGTHAFATCEPGYCCYTGDDDWPRLKAADAGVGLSR